MSEYWQVWVRYESLPRWRPWGGPNIRRPADALAAEADESSVTMEVAICPAVGPPDGFSVLGCSPEPQQITLAEARRLAIQAYTDSEQRRVDYAQQQRRADDAQFQSEIAEQLIRDQADAQTGMETNT